MRWMTAIRSRWTKRLAPTSVARASIRRGSWKRYDLKALHANHCGLLFPFGKVTAKRLPFDILRPSFEKKISTSLLAFLAAKGGRAQEIRRQVSWTHTHTLVPNFGRGGRTSWESDGMGLDECRRKFLAWEVLGRMAGEGHWPLRLA